MRKLLLTKKPSTDSIIGVFAFRIGRNSLPTLCSFPGLISNQAIIFWS